MIDSFVKSAGSTVISTPSTDSRARAGSVVRVVGGRARVGLWCGWQGAGGASITWEPELENDATSKHAMQVAADHAVVGHRAVAPVLVHRCHKGVG